MTHSPSTDPVVARRALVARAVRLGKAVGYACFGAAVVLFAVGWIAGFGGGLSAVIVALLLLGCVALPPAIVFGYGLRAAERHELEEALRRRPDGHPTRPPTSPTTPSEPPRA